VNQKVKMKTARKQTALSLIILGVLIVIAGGVFFAQFNYSPAVQQQSSALPANAKRSTAAPVSAEKSMISFPSGQSPLSSPETFDAATLSDKINGKAELYLSSGFTRLYCQRFKDRSAGDVWMEAFVYDMQSTQNAFSVFSAQRRVDAQTLDIGQYSYQTQNAVFFVHGPFYVEIVASDISETIIQPMLAFAEAFIAKHPVKTQTIGEKELFPEKGLIQNSISLVSSDAFGYDRFDHIFTAAYKINGIELMAYFSRRKTQLEAQELAASYQSFLTAFGGKTTESDLAIKAAKMIHILDTYEVVFTYGPYLAGVREAADKRPALELAMQLFNRIKEATRE
jgi:hypothetical protein